MVVVAGVVIVILLSWLSSVNHPGIGSVVANFYGKGNAAIVMSACTGGHTPLCTNQAPSGGCTFINNTAIGSTQPPLVVSVYDTKGNPMSGVSVSLTLSSGFSWHNGVPTTEITQGNGNAVFPDLSGSILPNTASGTITILASATSGTSTSGSAILAINAPNTC
jgi:hypothetical protein